MTRPFSVPGVCALMSTANSSDPFSGTSKALVLMAMYLRWSNTLTSEPTWNGTALTVTPCFVTVRVPPAASSNGPKVLAHIAAYAASLAAS